jgi:hypothetical protein
MVSQSAGVVDAGVNRLGFGSSRSCTEFGSLF